MAFSGRLAVGGIRALVSALGPLWAVGTLALSSGCVPPSQWGYVGKLAYTQLNISLHSQPLREALTAENRLSADERRKLALVLEVKEFCEGIGLGTSGVYDNYSRAARGELFLVAASERLKFKQYEWRWPIVGRLPYKGFFDERSAAAEAHRLAQKNLDVYMGRASGYSTIGWFSDRFLPAMFRLDDLSLTELVIHEATHRSIFKKGFASFNEGVATHIGRRGAILFVRKKYGQESAALRALLARLAAGHLVERAVGELYSELQAVYESSLSAEEKAQRRANILSVYALRLAGAVSEADLNNAWILLRRVYTQRLGSYENVHEALGGDLEQIIQFFKSAAASAGDPDEHVTKWLAEKHVAE